MDLFAWRHVRCSKRHPLHVGTYRGLMSIKFVIRLVVEFHWMCDAVMSSEFQIDIEKTSSNKEGLENSCIQQKEEKRINYSTRVVLYGFRYMLLMQLN